MPAPFDPRSSRTTAIPVLGSGKIDDTATLEMACQMRPLL
jgi:hypothetical protein